MTQQADHENVDVEYEYEIDEHDQSGAWRLLGAGVSKDGLWQRRRQEECCQHILGGCTICRAVCSVYTILTLNLCMLPCLYCGTVLSVSKCESPHLPNSTGVQWGSTTEFRFEARFIIGTLDSGASSGRSALAFGTTVLNSP